MNRHRAQVHTSEDDGMYHPDKIDRALGFGAGFDWITPLFSLIGGFRNKVEHFAVPQYWTGFAHSTLDEAGIKICNGFFVDGQYLFDIRKRDAQRAAELLGLVRK